MDDSWDMNEVIPNLWLGDLRSAQNTEKLRQNNIHSILSAMRGKVVVAETFNRLQISLDDTDEEDILKHLVVAITFMQSELDKGRGVLVHCMAGISRSTSMVAAYLMYSRGLSPEEALALIRKARPMVEPNGSFLAQLQIFYQASCKVSMHDKAIRMYYLERMVKGILNGEEIDREVLAVPAPNSWEVNSSGRFEPRRRIRCKMCRQELATRENMQEHGQLSSPSPAVAYSPIVSSPPSFSSISNLAVSRDILDGAEPDIKPSVIDEAEELGRQLSESVTLLESDENLESSNAEKNPPNEAVDDSDELEVEPAPRRTPPPAISSFPNARLPAQRPAKVSSRLAHPSDISAQLYSNPAIAALRPGLSVVPAPSPSLVPTPRGASTPVRQASSSSILINPKCSGYFVEPLKWMEPFLEKGQLSGKILCPNKKCNAKLGNYDWAGVCCSCKEWIVPGFCIHRSKIDEVV